MSAISDDAKDSIQRVCYGAIHDDAFATSDQMLDALVPHVERIVADELRRLADWHWDSDPAVIGMCDALRARADELEGLS